MHLIIMRPEDGELDLAAAIDYLKEQKKKVA